MDTLHDIVLILHVLGAGVIIGIGVLALAIAKKKTLSPEEITRLQWVGKFGLPASIVQLVTGLYLASADWGTLHSSKIFWTKMIVFVLQGVIAGRFIAKKVKAAGEGKGGLFAILLLHSLMILTIVALGVMIIEHFE